MPVQRLKARGLKICVWINPYIAQRSALFEEGMQNGYLLKRAEMYKEWHLPMYGKVSPTPHCFLQ